jgi:hypothetical protein
MAEVIPGSFSRVSDGRPVHLGLAQQADARSKRLMELYKSPIFGFAQQGFTPKEGRASMGLPETPNEKYNTSIEAMKQFNLDTFQRAAPGTIFGQGDSGFQSPKMKAREMGFNNIYDSLFGRGGSFLNNY